MARWAPGTIEKALEMYYNGNKSLQIIADELGISRTHIYRKIKSCADPEKRAKAKIMNYSWAAKKREFNINSQRWDEICNDFSTTTMTLSEIAAKHNTSTGVIKKALFASGRLSHDYIHKTIKERQAAAGSLYHGTRKYAGVQSGGRYLNVEAPYWMERQYVKNLVSEHIVVICENMRLASIPDGYIVHHVNNDSKDNRFENLVLMTRGEHTSLHKYLKGLSTISKESTLKWVEARRQGADKSVLRDIVRSAQECAAASKVAGTE